MPWHSMNDMTRAGCTSRRGVRHWESEGLLGDVSRSDGGTRRYSPRQLDLARIIAAAQFGGWSLEEIKDMLSEWGAEAYEAICTRLTAQIHLAERLIEELPKPVTIEDFDL